jgi:hypothetical protein
LSTGIKERRENMGGFIIIIILGLSVVQPVWGQGLEVREIRVEAQEVVFWDEEAGRELVVRPGDLMQGWTVMKITENDLTVSYLGDDNIIHTTDLPIRSRIRMHRPAP